MTRHGTGEATGLVVAGLAAFFAVLGLLPGSLAIGPAVPPALNSPETLVLTASNASYLSPVTLREVSGARIVETRTVTPDDSAGSSSVAVWTVTTSDYDTTHRQQLEPSSRTFAVDRASGQLVSCCGANIDGNLLIRQSGLSGYLFPAGTRTQAYDIFDSVLRRPEPAVYSGSGTIEGIAAYRYTEDITAARAGPSPLSSTDQELYSAADSYWVDPETGAVLAITISEDLSLARPVGAAPATGGASAPAVADVLNMDLTTDKATVKYLVAQDRSVRHEITLARDLRLACLALAVLLAVAAWYTLSRRRSPPAPRHPHARKRHGGNGGREITEAPQRADAVAASRNPPSQAPPYRYSSGMMRQWDNPRTWRGKRWRRS
ncbi:MAG TPA: porin PorA family protein [Trebonia sp.]|nr:porin PorA family protein [Trebonia sp.]